MNGQGDNEPARPGRETAQDGTADPSEMPTVAVGLAKPRGDIDDDKSSTLLARRIGPSVGGNAVASEAVEEPSTKPVKRALSEPSLEPVGVESAIPYPAAGAPAFSGDSPKQTSIAAKDRGGPALVTGWLVIVDGPGRGKSFALGAGKHFVGRDPGNTIVLDFGDSAISRESVCVVYEDGARQFHLFDRGSRNAVRVNGEIMLQSRALLANDRIKLGKTTLSFVPLCGESFDWNSGA